jgi:hypothetical protein
MKLEFNIHGTFEFDFSEERQKELIRDAKDYPGGVTALLLDNLEVARDYPSTESTFTLDPYQVAVMLSELAQKEKEENADD